MTTVAGYLVSVQGVPVRLEPGHTRDSILADMAYADSHRRPLLCWLRHRRVVIGRPAVHDQNPATMTLAVAGLRLVTAVVRCERCRHIEVRNGL